MQHPRYVGVVGPFGPQEPSVLEQAFEAGAALARAGCVVVTGGLGGVMAAAAAGVASVGGTALALLPGTDRAESSEGHTVVVPTGMGEMRNALLVRTVDGVLALGGSWGTLSEVALAARTGVPVVSVGGWDLPGPEVRRCADVTEAVAVLLAAGSQAPHDVG